jgi:hypothetical protein
MIKKFSYICRKVGVAHFSSTAVLLSEQPHFNIKVDRVQGKLALYNNYINTGGNCQFLDDHRQSNRFIPLRWL